jgi:hypothetical protein
MEWLEFNGWSPEVVQSLTRQQRRVALAARGAPARAAHPAAAALGVLLSGLPRSNPWGHTPSEG